MRKAANLTQPQLATKVGVTVDTIKRIENGTLTMSEKIAFKLRAELGCPVVRTADVGGNPAWTVSNIKPRRTDPTSLYTLADFKAHQQTLKALSSDADTLRGHLAAALLMLLKGAERAGRLGALRIDIRDQLARWTDGYEIDAHVGGWLRDQGIGRNESGDLVGLLKADPVQAGRMYRRIVREAAMVAREAAKEDAAKPPVTKKPVKPAPDAPVKRPRGRAST